MKQLFLTLSILLSAYMPTFGQQTEYPLIGAQVFIEPGQSAEEIDVFSGR